MFQQLDEKISAKGSVNPLILIKNEAQLPVPTNMDTQKTKGDIILHRRETPEGLDQPEFGRTSKVYAQ